MWVEDGGGEGVWIEEVMVIFSIWKRKFKKALKKEWEHHIAISCFIVMDGKNFWGPVNGGGVF